MFLYIYTLSKENFFIFNRNMSIISCNTIGGSIMLVLWLYYFYLTHFLNISITITIILIRFILHDLIFWIFLLNDLLYYRWFISMQNSFMNSNSFIKRLFERLIIPLNLVRENLSIYYVFILGRNSLKKRWWLEQI